MTTTTRSHQQDINVGKIHLTDCKASLNLPITWRCTNYFTLYPYRKYRIGNTIVAREPHIQWKQKSPDLAEFYLFIYRNWVKANRHRWWNIEVITCGETRLNTGHRRIHKASLIRRPKVPANVKQSSSLLHSNAEWSSSVPVCTWKAVLWCHLVL
jgi:hypothetical protein